MSEGPQPIVMSLTCGGCGQRIHNDDPTIVHPLDFLTAAEARGWIAKPARAPICPTCVTKALSKL